MASDYCIVIPHYRHVAPLLKLLERLTPHALPIVVVDDASGTDACSQLASAVNNQPGLTLLQRTKNGGKGAAVITGLRYAREHGFSHALSMDADGQHDPDEVPRFVAASRREPSAVYSGLPQFGPEIPAARLHGRKITNTLVQIESGSSSVRDAMCGLRVYPLASVLPLCSRIGYRTRMEFDVEILVRARWAGVPVNYLETPVVYPEDGTSHFRMLRDNARLTIMHTLLLFGALIRAPLLLSRRAATGKQS